MQIQRRRGPDRNSVRFKIGAHGSERMVEYHKRRQYRQLQREMPHWEAELDVREDDDGD